LQARSFEMTPGGVVELDALSSGIGDCCLMRMLSLPVIANSAVIDAIGLI
jgi:hypothetical protein